MAHMKTGPKLVLIALAAVGGMFALRTAAERGWIPVPGIAKSLVPLKAGIPLDVKEAKFAGTAETLPSETPCSISATPIRGEIWEWNAQANMILANGGPKTTCSSLMEKHKVNLNLFRQDDTGQMQADLITCAKEIRDGASQCSAGANFVVIMGDGSGQFLAAMNPQLKKLGPNYIAKVIGATGYSRGEDAFLAPAAVRADKEAARGLLIAGVLRDGDWNIALKWGGDNSIPNNPDEKTYDPTAMNWVNAADYLKAAEMYNSQYCEDRKVVKDGHPTGETKHVCVDSVVTWTPGDVNIAKGRGGLVKVVSSKQYRSQMPAVILGSEKFFQDNRDEIAGMLAATFEAGDQMKAFDKAAHKAAALSAKVYNDQDEAYWFKYFRGVTERDQTGATVELGGSAVNNLEDEKILFGLSPGSNDNFRSTYSVFASIVLQQYPILFKDTPIPAVADIEDKTFIRQAEDLMNGTGSAADVPAYAEEAKGPQVSSRSYQINFDTNQATFTQDGEKTMRELRDSLAITGLFIRVDGYTDNAGNDSINIPLSQRRARAVQQWLQNAAPNNFPSSRFHVEGHGSQNPVDSNATDAGRARNRRVDITLTGE